jgi:hypothetical protein
MPGGSELLIITIVSQIEIKEFTQQESPTYAFVTSGGLLPSAGASSPPPSWSISGDGSLSGVDGSLLDGGSGA